MKVSIGMLLIIIFLFAIVTSGFYYYQATAPTVIPVVNYGATTSTEADVIPVDLVATSSILFVGDVMLARSVERTMNQYDPVYPFRDVRQLFDQHNQVVVNFESSIPRQHIPTPSMTMTFSTQVPHATSLAKWGVTHASLANNHSDDYGTSDYNHTLTTLVDAGIEAFGQAGTVGTSSVTFFQSGSSTVSIIGVDYTVSAISQKQLELVFNLASKHSDVQIAFVHWGIEYAPRHSTGQEQTAAQLVKLGADLIIGHHPHVVQDIQMIGDTPVFYSLGNFVFDQFFNLEVQRGLALSVLFDTPRTIKLVPVSTIGSRIAPREMRALEKRDFLKELAKKSDQRIRAEIERGIVPW